ncbi:ATP-dependent RNA helicase RhlE [Pseudoalteromonas luteoviolacea B = ATCC 29581]|nr:ATP-dependent RNA helicase RhlE [Pseudoalteromonas luteoviolacea B = ATCC 29581]
MHFSDLGLLPEITQALLNKGYETPTPIQAKAIPAIIDGRDVMAAAQTGTGKTAGFTLPMLQLLSRGPKARANYVRALVLTPTRELADQVWQNVETYSQNLKLSCQVVYGGVKINPQMMNLRKGADILVATPGRLLDLFSQNALKFDHLEMLVLDEADRMLDMGFIHDIKRIIKLLPRKRQNLLFSATFSDEIRELAKGLINDPIEISVAPKNSTAKSVEQLVYEVDKGKRAALLKHLITTYDWQQVLVFTRTKHGANRLVRDLESAKLTAAAIHGNKSQSARMKALNGFKAQEVRVLVATDIVARGLDIQELPHVVNFDLPNVYEDYVHRIGRTGRAGASGEAVSFVTKEDALDLFGIERLIQQVITRKVEPGFEPKESIPESKLDTRPIKAKKPKKPKKPKPQTEQAGETPAVKKPVAKPKKKPNITGSKPQNEPRKPPKTDQARPKKPSRGTFRSTKG